MFFFAPKCQKTCSNVMFSGHCGGRGLLCERRRPELQVPRWENRLPLGPLQHHRGRFRTQPEREEISAGGRRPSIFSRLFSVEVKGQLNLLLFSFSLIQMQIYCHDPNDFQSLDEALKSGGRIAALAVLFEVGPQPRLQHRNDNNTLPGFKSPS